MCSSKIWGNELRRFLSDLDIRPQQSKNEDPECKNHFKVARQDESYTVFFFGRSIQTHGLVVKAGRSE